MKYSDKLKDPRWQKKRLEVFQRDEFKCVGCGDKETTLHVHHRKYKGEPWDAPMDHLETLCEDCHEWMEEFKELIERTAFGKLNCSMFNLMNMFYFMKPVLEENKRPSLKFIRKRVDEIELGVDAVRAAEGLWVKVLGFVQTKSAFTGSYLLDAELTINGRYGIVSIPNPGWELLNNEKTKALLTEAFSANGFLLEPKITPA
jgi:hypothetical protein